MAAEFLRSGGSAGGIDGDGAEPGFEGLTVAQFVAMTDDGHCDILKKVVNFYFAGLVDQEDGGDPAAVLLPEFGEMGAIERSWIVGW